jgi:hypothetical protein
VLLPESNGIAGNFAPAPGGVKQARGAFLLAAYAPKYCRPAGHHRPLTGFRAARRILTEHRMNVAHIAASESLE